MVMMMMNLILFEMEIVGLGIGTRKVEEGFSGGDVTYDRPASLMMVTPLLTIGLTESLIAPNASAIPGCLKKGRLFKAISFLQQSARGF